MQENLKWEHQQRLTLLEATVFWSGEVSTNVLVEVFGISRVQASKDFTAYQNFCPDNIRYDKYLKRYVINPDFKPAFMRGTVAEFLQVLKLRQQPTGGALVGLVGNLPIVDVLEPVFRQVDVAVLQCVNQAIVGHKELTVTYQSMSSNEPSTLRLCPHALAFDGLRWHTRAFSHKHQEYRDFVLARMRSAILGNAADADGIDDWTWRQLVTVRIGPHPGLNTEQKAVVEFDYGMVDGVLEHQVRTALLPYFLRLMRIGKDAHERDAMAQQIVLLNREELAEYWRF